MWETSNSPLGRGPVGHQHGLPRGRLAGGRADREPRKVRHGLRSPADDPALLRAPRPGPPRPTTSPSTRSRRSGRTGHYFGSSTRRTAISTAFYAPIVSDWRNYEAWQLDGSRLDARTRAPDLQGRSWPSSRPRRWTRDHHEELRASSPGANPKAARRPISDHRRACHPPSSFDFVSSSGLPARGATKSRDEQPGTQRRHPSGSRC